MVERSVQRGGFSVSFLTASTSSSPLGSMKPSRVRYPLKRGVPTISASRAEPTFEDSTTMSSTGIIAGMR